MEQRLQFILQVALDSVKYAESKNAALFAGNIAIFAGLVTLFSIPQMPFVLQLYFYNLLGFLVLGGLCSLFSFVPVTTSFDSNTSKPSKDDNLLFFGNILKYNKLNYLQRLYLLDGTEIEPDKLTPLEVNYSEQIIINSKIAMHKFKLFDFAVLLDMCAFLTVLLGPIFWFIYRKNILRFIEKTQT